MDDHPRLDRAPNPCHRPGVRMSTVRQRLRDEQGLAASAASFRRYVAANIPEEVRRAQVTVWNPRPAEAG